MSRRTASLTPEYFETLYRADPDPWRFASSDYERAKYAATTEALGQRRFRRAFEIGCSIGVLTRQLAARCDRLLGVDVSETALAQARSACSRLPGVSLARMRVPDEWPEETFDLILLSEVVYYLAPADIDRIAMRATATLRPEGLALLVHWTGPTDYPVSGDDAAERFIAASGLTPSLQRRAPEYRLDLLRGRR